MDPRKSSKLKNQNRGKLSKSRHVESSNDSSSDEKSDDEPHNLGSRIKLIRDKAKHQAKSLRKDRSKSTSRSDIEESENTIVQIESTEAKKPVQNVGKESIAQSLKKRFGFFRRSENVKLTEDVEAATVAEKIDTPTSDNKQTVDVVVDVHCENEQKSGVIKKNVTSKSFDEEKDSDDDKRSSPEIISKPLEYIEEIHDNKEKKTNNTKNGFFGHSESEVEIHSSMEHLEKSIEELPSEIVPTSGAESVHRRKRWEKAEISATDLVEDLTKPRRRQWAKGAASADIRTSTVKKTVVPKRSATAEPEKSVRPKSSRPLRPVAAPRSKTHKKNEDHQGFDNDGFSSDHDEVLRIETINDQSPKIEMSSSNIENIEDETFTLSEEEEKISSDRKPSIAEIQEYLPAAAESAENSDLKEKSASETYESLDFVKRRNIPKRRFSNKRKFSVDKRSTEVDEEDEEDDDDEEQETVLNVMEKKSRQSSSSSKIEIIPSNFFKRESSDETTISTNEEMHTSRKDSHRSRSRSKSKSSRREKSDDASEKSSRTKRKTTSSSTRNSTEEGSTVQKVTKSKTKKRHKKKEKNELEEVEEEMKYISIKIHRSDMLEADYITRHPMVKVHIVYADTGEYLKLKNKEENETENETLQPIITRKFDFKEKQSMVPIWEEELIFLHDFKDLLTEGKGSLLILFEIVDLLTFSEASVGYDQYGKDACWYKVAWAFLRPVGMSGVQHVNKRIRLQLYRPKKTFRKFRKNKAEVYKWWKSNSRDKYPSSLYVTVTAVDPPKLEPVFYEQLLHLNDLSDVRRESQNILSPKPEEKPTEPLKWTRLAAQSCQIPNETLLETEASDNGCFYVVFSNNGKYLACALSEEYDYPILVYKIDEGKIHVRFSGHKNFIYSLSWSQDDRYLLSVSSDQTARLWDVREKIIEHVQSLPHPSYVYCGRFSHDSINYVVTGCYDHVARVWAQLRSRDSHQYELIQELEAHESFVSAIYIQSKDETIITGDGNGVIIVWVTKKSRKSFIRREWQIARKIKIREIESIPINTIVMHPLGSRLLVHSRNNGLRLMDMISGVVIKKFEGLKNQRIQMTACISPCGTLLFCGGEDSKLNVWSVDTGKLLATYEIESHEKAVTCVDYHPYDHVVAFTIYGAPIPVKVLKFDREADGKKVGLKLLAMTTSMISINSSARLKEPPVIMRNGFKNLEKLSVRSLNTSTNVSQNGSVNRLLTDYKDEEEARWHLKGKLQKLMESGPNLKAKSMNRLNGIIEKIDRILLYAANPKSPTADLESARRSSVFTVEEKRHHGQIEAFELQDLSEEQKKKSEKNVRKHRQRSKSARNACSPTSKEIENSKAFSDSAAFLNRKVSRFSDDSSNSNRSIVQEKLIVERLDLEKIEYVDTESGFKDSLDTIIDGKEDFPSEEVLDIESLKSDDTYVIDKEKKSPANGSDSSQRSNATFIIETEVPIPKPRKRTTKIEVM